MAPEQAVLKTANSMERIDEVTLVHAARTPSAPCISFEGRHWRYDEVDALVDTLSAGLARAGIRPGHRVAVLSTPRPEYLLCLLAISRAGGVYVGVNPRYTAAEVARLVVSVRPQLIISLREFEGRSFGELFEQAEALADLPPIVHFDGVDACVAAIDSLPIKPVDPSTADDVDNAGRDQMLRCAAIVFTSGTTGRPKAAMLTHEGLLLAAAVQHERLNPPQPRYLCNLPINHVGCLMNLTLGALVAGGSVVFQERFAPEQTLRLIADEKVTCWLQVPAMFHECVQHIRFTPRLLGHLRSICVGGGAPSLSTIKRLRSIGARVFVEYGQTETSSSATYSDDGADDQVLSRCIGRFDPRFKFRIADGTGRTSAIGDVGEIQGTGPLIFSGYFGDPDATRAAFTEDGWLRTGDLATARADGNIELKGRLKEMIKSGGYNVYPREVEMALEDHPAVSQVVVLGLPDERFGETVHAALVVRGSAPARADLESYCRRTLANYKVPKSFRLMGSFPLLPNGKVDRVRTRELAALLDPMS